MRTIFLLLLSGCSVLPLQFGTPGFDETRRYYQHSAEYDLLDQTAGSECARADEIDKLPRIKSRDPRTIGPPVLFEGAKYNAMGRIKGCDGLVGLRAKVESTAGNLCVAVTGHCYRIRSIRAEPDRAPTQPERVRPKETLTEPDFGR